MTGVTVVNEAKSILEDGSADIAVVAVGSYLNVMDEHFKLCLEHGVNVITIEEESFYPWRTAPALAAELTESRAKTASRSRARASRTSTG